MSAKGSKEKRHTMAPAKHTGRQPEHRQSWLQRHTISAEAGRILEQQEDLRNEVRARMRFI